MKINNACIFAVIGKNGRFFGKESPIIADNTNRFRFCAVDCTKRTIFPTLCS